MYIFVIVHFITMEILSASQLKQVDDHTVQVQGITFWQLMERASEALLRRLEEDFGQSSKRYVLFCGPGNNGGDGLALARMLAKQGHNIDVYLTESLSYSPDNLQNQKFLMDAMCHNPGQSIHLLPLGQPMVIDACGVETIVVDALFGYGLTRTLEHKWCPVIEWINRHTGPVISIDMPSGLFADRPSDPNAPIVSATKTYTFHAPKMGLLQPQNAHFMGEMVVLNIGLDTSILQSETLIYHYIQPEQVYALIPPINRFVHKGTFGHVLIAGGSHGKIGSVLLSSRAALRTGCGLVTVYVPACGYGIVQTAFPEAMVLTGGDENNWISELPPAYTLATFKAIGLGMGMGATPATTRALRSFLRNLSQLARAPALVLDADALNILSEDPNILDWIPKGTILTPHPKELQRLIGPWGDDWQKLEKTQAFAREHQVITLIKGANTAVALPDGSIHFNSTGNWGMATGGSGDVLTGMIASLLAQGVTAEAAAITGVYLHGLTGDLTIQNMHPKSLIASDLIAHIGEAWGCLVNNNPGSNFT